MRLREKEKKIKGGGETNQQSKTCMANRWTKCHMKHGSDNFNCLPSITVPNDARDPNHLGGKTNRHGREGKSLQLPLSPRPGNSGGITPQSIQASLRFLKAAMI